MMAAARHGLIVYMGTIVSSLIMLAAKVLINKNLGVEVLGQYELGLSLILLISVFALFGFHTSMARTIAKEGERAYPLVRKSYIWVVCVSTIAILISTPLINWLYGSKVTPNFSLYLSLLLLAVCLLNLNMAFFQGLQKMVHVSAIMALDAVARGGAIAVALILAFNAQSILLIIGLFAIIFELILTIRIDRITRSHEDGDMPFREFAHLSFYIFLIAASGTISTRVSAFVIAYSLTIKELGFFAIATLFILPLSLLGRTIETVLLPRASSGRSFELRRFAAFSFVLAVGSVPLYFLLSNFGVGLLFGDGNEQAVDVLKVLSVGYSAILVYSVFSAFIFGRAPRNFLGKLVAVTFLQALVVVPVLNFYLVERMGLMGAAWATNIALVIQAGLWVCAGLILERGERTEVGKNPTQ